MESIELTRYGIPGKLDTAPYGTICRSNISGIEHLYVQTSYNEEDPIWEEYIMTNSSKGFVDWNKLEDK